MFLFNFTPFPPESNESGRFSIKGGLANYLGTSAGGILHLPMYLVSFFKPHFDWSCTSSRLTYVPFSSLLSGCCLFNLQWIRLWSWNFSTLLRGKVTLRKSIATRSDATGSSIVIWRRVPSSWRPRELTRKIRFILTEDWPLVESLPPTPMDYRPLSHRGVLRSSASSFNLVCIFRFSGASAFPVPSPLLISLRAGKKHLMIGSII